MGFVFSDGTASIGTTEHSLPANAAYSSGSPQTTPCIMQAVIDFNAMVLGDEYQVRIYDSVNNGTQRPIYQANLVGPQLEMFISPSLIVNNEWDVTVDQIAGAAARQIVWSIRKVT